MRLDQVGRLLLVGVPPHDEVEDGLDIGHQLAGLVILEGGGGQHRYNTCLYFTPLKANLCRTYLSNIIDRPILLTHSV